tara:strand:+ start:1584 stop:1814 length:231 start_codon:yes stop_codon:yes gene_type:complete
MDEVIIWTASWCMPCKGLKAWTDVHYPLIIYKDIENETPPYDVKSVPTLQVGGVFISTVSTIKQYLSKRGNQINGS